MHGKTRYSPTVGFLLPFTFLVFKKVIAVFLGLDPLDAEYW